MNKNVIPIFYACDDAFVKYTIISLKSMISNASKEYNYKIHILNTNISDAMKEKVFALATANFEIEFNDVTNYLNSIADKLPLRDYYSKTTYYRLFIAEMFDYNKAIYIDSDTIVLGDISELYNEDIKDNYVGACLEQVMVQTDVFGTYVEKCVGIDRNKFFNAGLLLINCDEFRKNDVLLQFLNLLKEYNFVVTQDEDYLNVICKDKVFYIDQRWNTEVYGNINYDDDEIKMLHYIMVSKPWHYKDCRYSSYFWEYAKQTSVYEEVLDILNNYSSVQKEKDLLSCERLEKLAIAETVKENNYLNLTMKKSKERLAIIKKINEYEHLGKFDEDVEEDPPTLELLPDKVDYKRKKISSKIKTKVAFGVARKFLNKIIKDKNMIIKEIKGLENLKNLDSGAVLTCNHFNAFDSFAMHVVYDESKHKKRKFYRVIREGNYTNFPGFYGFLMRNCNTLPLSSNKDTMNLFMKSTVELLKEGNFVLVYPEQSMWWNYRKPKPLKKGAFVFAVKADVPVIPCFITMEDSDRIGEDGFYIQEYTINIGQPIYVNKEINRSGNINYLKEENYRVWKEIYEDFYGVPLRYSTSDAAFKN